MIYESKQLCEIKEILFIKIQFLSFGLNGSVILWLMIAKQSREKLNQIQLLLATRSPEIFDLRLGHSGILVQIFTI